MPGYIACCLQRFEHPKPTRPQHSPHAYSTPQFGAKIQYATGPDESPTLHSTDTKRVQEVLGTLLFYARAIDGTMLPVIGTLATKQCKNTEATMQGITQLLRHQFQTRYSDSQPAI